jgi:hypothetical protein
MFKKLIVSKAMFNRCFLAWVAVWSSASIIRGDVIFSFMSVPFVENSGIQEITMLARSTSADSLISYIADFELLAGNFSLVPMSFNGPSRLGSGNIDPASIAFRDTTDPKFAYLSVDFSSPQLFPNTFQPFATLNVNVHGLSPGNYQFRVNFAEGNAGQIPVGTPTGSFTIVPIPEPSGAIMTSLAVGLVAHRRRRKRATY